MLAAHRDNEAMASVVIASSQGEVEELRPAWNSLPVDHPHADPDFFLSVIAARDAVVRPHAVVVSDAGCPVGLVAMRLEQTRLPASFGYRTIYNPRVRSLTLVPGGAVLNDPTAAAAAERSLLDSLQAAEADVAVLPSLRCDSALFASLTSSVGPARRSHFSTVRTHRRLHLPGSFDEFLTRPGRRRCARASAMTPSVSSSGSVGAFASSGSTRSTPSTPYFEMSFAWPI